MSTEDLARELFAAFWGVSVEQVRSGAWAADFNTVKASWLAVAQRAQAILKP